MNKRIGIALAIMLLQCQQVVASVLYGADGITLFQVDFANAKYIPINPLGNVNSTDLASDWRPESFRFFATASIGTNRLNIMQYAPDGTLIKTVSNTVNAPEGIGGSLAFDIVTNKLYSFGGNQNILYRLDPDTGAVDKLGTINPINSQSSVGMTGAAFDSNGVLWATGVDITGANTTYMLYKINISTLAVSRIPATTYFGLPFEVTNDIAFRPEDGVLFGTSFSEGIFTIDTTNGAESHSLIKTNPPLFGLAFGPVPEPNLWCAAILLACRRRCRHV